MQKSWVRAVATAALVGLVVASTACSGEDDTDGSADTVTTSGDSVLGPLDVAHGEPVEIGFVSDGASAVADQSGEIDIAEAVVDYINEHRGGLGGRPIELVLCTTEADPAKATDCGNQMVEAGVPAVLIGASAVMEAVWEPIHAAGISTFFTQASPPAVLSDSASTFIFGDGVAGALEVPISMAVEGGIDKVTVIVIDVPAAVDVFSGGNAQRFDDAGLELEVVRAPFGTADMTPQLQDPISNDPGVVLIVGNDTFCISALQALSALAFDGPLALIPQCVSDATIQAVAPEQLEGIIIGSPAPGGAEDETDELFRAVVETYGTDIDQSHTSAQSAFIVVAAFREALEGVTGDLTAENIIATVKAMPDRELPGGGGLHFRCNGTATSNAAECVRGTLRATLGSDGRAVSYEPTSTAPIED